MERWSLPNMPSAQDKPPLPAGIPEEWQKANEALQAVKQPAKSVTTETPSPKLPESAQKKSLNEYTPYGWQQPMYPPFSGYTSYPPTYNYYNYNYPYMVANNPYFVNPVSQVPNSQSSAASAPVPVSKGRDNGEENSQLSTNTSSAETTFFTDVSSSNDVGPSIRFNAPLKKTNSFQATREALQKRMNNFRPAYSPPQKNGSLQNPTSSNAASPNSVSSMTPDSWPQSLRLYVQRCFDKCKTDFDKDQVELILKGKLMKANNDGSLKHKDWDTEPLPSTHSDRLEEEEQSKKKQAVLYQKLPNVLRTQERSTDVPAQKNSFYPKPRVHTYRTRSRSRSFSRSRSRSPARKVIRRRKYSSSSDSDSDSRGSRKGLNSVIGPTEDRNVRNAPNHFKIKKKKKKPKMFFTPEPEFGSEDRLMKRAARFESKAAKTQKPNLLFTISRNPTPLFVVDDGGSDIEWGSDAVVGTCQDLEKPFLRLTGAVDPSSVRPQEVLTRSLLMVKKHWVEKLDYHFACEQLKSIRQDLVVQCIRNSFTVQVYETHARIALEKGDHTEFNQCQSQLKVLYPEVKEGNRLEFTGYHILYTMYTENSIELKNILSSLTAEEERHEVVLHALKLAKACSSNNYCRFFKLYLVAPKMSSFVIDWFIERVRKAAIKAIIKSFRPNIPISHIEGALAFQSKEECLSFLTKAGLTLVDESTLNCKESVAALANL